MMRRRRDRDDRGTAIVEFALLVPLLIVLLVGTIQFGIAYNRKQGLHAAAREGARLASLPTATSGQISARVNDALTGVPLAGSPSIVISPGMTRPCENRRGQSVTVTVSAATTLDIPLWGVQNVTMVGRGSFRCEG
jgi:Flp pilus assembly protein TadG